MNLFKTENLVLGAKSEFHGFAGKEGIEIPNHKSQISNKSQ